MRKAFLSAATTVVALAVSTSSPTQDLGPVEGNSFVIGNVRVFDGAQVIEQATVIVRNGLVDTLGTQVMLPKDVPIIDGTGKTLIPGLIDAHTHNARDETLSDAVCFGVTTELNMSSSVREAQSQRLRREKIERVELADFWSSGTPATAPGGLGTSFGYPVPTSRLRHRPKTSSALASPRERTTSKSFTSRGVRGARRFLEELSAP